MADEFGGIDQYTKTMLHMNGTNGSTTFTDSSITGHAFTANGNAQLTTTSPKYGTACGLFDGTGDTIQATDNAELDLPGVFSIDGFFNITNFGSYDRLISRFTSAYTWDTDSEWGWGVGTGWGSGVRMNFAYYNSGVQDLTTNGLSISSGTWYHVALVRNSSSVFKMYLDGTLVYTSGTHSKDLSPNLDLYFGGLGGNGEFFDGKLDEWRLSVGVDRSTGGGSTFPVPAAEYYRGGGNTADYICINRISGISGNESDNIGVNRVQGISGNETDYTGKTKVSGTGGNESDIIGVNRILSDGGNNSDYIGVNRMLTYGGNDDDYIGVNRILGYGGSGTSLTGRTAVEQATGYDVYIDGVYNKYSATSPIDVTGLSGPNTYYVSCYPRGKMHTNKAPSHTIRVRVDAGFNILDPIPNDPSSLVARAVADGAIELTWSYNTASQGVVPDHFEVWANLNGAGYAQIDTVDYPTREYQATGYSDGDSVAFKIRADDGSSNNSDYSNEETVTADAEASGDVPLYQIIRV